MLGNTKGWILAALVLLIEIVAVSLLLGLDSVSGPSAIGADPGATLPIALPVDPSTVVKIDQAGDAGPLYRDAADAYIADASLYETFIRDRDRATIPKLTAIDKLLAATHLRAGVIYAATPDAVVMYGDAAPIQGLERVGLACIDAGLLLEKRDPAKAHDHYEAAFSLGKRLVDERLTYREFTAGVTLMSTAAASLAEQAKRANHPDEAAAIAQFSDAERDYVTSRIIPTIEALDTFNESKIAQHSGDVFVFATKSQERMWRVEAILKLGRMRYNVGVPGRPSDQRHAARLATRLAETETDPATRRAAVIARDLTIEEFRVLR